MVDENKPTEEADKKSDEETKENLDESKSQEEPKPESENIAEKNEPEEETKEIQPSQEPEESKEKPEKEETIPESELKEESIPDQPVVKEPTEIKPKKETKESPKKKDDKKDDFQYIVRIANTDIDGDKTVVHGLTQVKGIGYHMGVLIADAAGVERELKIGDLKEPQIDKIKNVLENINKTAPSWMLNHRKDYDTGEDVHLISSEVEMRLRDDVNLLKMIRSYRGIRHESGLAVRGQRTRANGRRGLAMGVSRRSQQQKSS